MSAQRRMRRQSGKRRRRQPSPARQTSGKPAGPDSPERIDLDRSELESILEHAKTALSKAEYDKLHAAMETLIYLTQELEKKRVSILDDLRIALFFTGRRHAGENLLALLRQRASELGRPIQMCDALSRNMPEELKTIIANCLSHGRRRFVDVAMNFPQQSLYVLEILKDVYTNDAEAKRQGMSDQQRLRFHQRQSGPKMDELKAWLTEQIEQHKVEPNSSLGEAISYMLKHWEKLTLFLKQPGAPLDNNLCERALKKAILHRKNSYFFKTQNGARVGDLFMSLIHTCELNSVNPFDYLTELQKHADELSNHPADWMPWNYQNRLQRNDVTHPKTHQTC
jgi:transposase